MTYPKFPVKTCYLKTEVFQRKQMSPAQEGPYKNKMHNRHRVIILMEQVNTWRWRSDPMTQK